MYQVHTKHYCGGKGLQSSDFWRVSRGEVRIDVKSANSPSSPERATVAVKWSTGSSVPRMVAHLLWRVAA
jgi:hypothetical protein